MEGYLIALIVAGVADAISFMVVSPSLIFYVLQQGGTKEQYGIIMSSFSLASFCAKPFVGYASDKLGFKLPYAISLGIACGGSLLYVMTNNIASSYDNTIPLTNGMNPSVFGILLARLLMGVGAANSALGYAYVARVVPSEQQTSVNAFLSMGRIGGMSVGPGFNALLSQVHIGHFLNPLNSVGLIVLVCNVIAIAAVFIFLQEPPSIEEESEEEEVIKSGATYTETDTEKANEKNDPKEQTPLLSSSSSSNTIQYSMLDKIIACLTTARIWVPICSIFMFNANFQFIETGFAPAASDGLGWGPVQISMVLGGLSIMVAAGFASVSYLSGKLKICDEHLLMGGLVVNALSYACVYFGWKRGVSTLCFILPVAGGALSFPFLAVPTRTIFTNGVKTQASLVKHMGSMQALLSMFASVAGFTIPTFVATYCNRPPEVVSEQNSHEMSKWTLVAPLMAIGVLIGVLYIHFFETKEEETVTKVTQDEVNKKNVSPPVQTTTTLTRESSSNLEGSTTNTFKIELEPGQVIPICRASHTNGAGGSTGTMRRSTTTGSASSSRRRSSCRRPSSAYLRNSETISLMCQSVLDQSHCLSLDDDDDEEERMSTEV